MFWFCLCHFFSLCSFCLHMLGVSLQRLAVCCRCSCQPPPHNPCGATVFRQSGCAPLRVSIFRNMEVCMGFLPFLCSSSSLHSFPLGFTIWGMYLLFLLFCLHFRWYSLLKWSSLITDIQTNQQRKRKSVNSVVCCMVGSTRSGNNSRPGMNLGAIRVCSLWL